MRSRDVRIISGFHPGWYHADLNKYLERSVYLLDFFQSYLGKLTTHWPLILEGLFWGGICASNSRMTYWFTNGRPQIHIGQFWLVIMKLRKLMALYMRVLEWSNLIHQIQERPCLPLRDLARWLEISAPGVGYSVERGEAIARENGYRLID